MISAKFLGHACFEILGDGKKERILIDPFLSDNPNAGASAGEMKPTHILLTHGHGDHVGDAITIAKATGAKVLGVFELMNYCASRGVENVIPAHMGGKIPFGFGWVKLVPAFHSSSTADGVYTGNPVGFVINYYGHHFYHAGDTGIFGDMALIARLYRVDTAMLPIGGTFTMDVADAVEATSMLRCRNVIPMHYNTFPPIEADPQVFKKKVEEVTKTRAIILNPGETVSFPFMEKVTAGV